MEIWYDRVSPSGCEYERTATNWYNNNNNNNNNNTNYNNNNYAQTTAMSIKTIVI